MRLPMVIGTCTSYAQHVTSRAQHGQGRAHALPMSRSLLHCPCGSDSRLASILQLFVLKLLPFRAVLFRNIKGSSPWSFTLFGSAQPGYSGEQQRYHVLKVVLGTSL